MAAKYSQEEREKQIKELCKGTIYSFVGWEGEYVGSQSHFLYQCALHGQSRAKVKIFINRGQRCAQCSSDNKRTPRERIENQILKECEKAGFVLQGWTNEYKGMSSSFTYLCKKHGIKSSTPEYFLKAIHKCRQCHFEALGAKRKNKPIVTAEEKEKQLQEKCKKEGHIFIGWTRGYMGCHSLITLCCPKCGEWSTKASVYLESGCPNCTTYGYSPNRKGTLYCLRSECGKFVKVGITNNKKSRFETLKRRTPFNFNVIELFTHEDGSKAREWEKLFHQSFESANLTGFDGCTEWLKWNPQIPLWFRFLT